MVVGLDRVFQRKRLTIGEEVEFVVRPCVEFPVKLFACLRIGEYVAGVHGEHIFQRLLQSGWQLSLIGVIRAVVNSHAVDSHADLVADIHVGEGERAARRTVGDVCVVFAEGDRVAVSVSGDDVYFRPVVAAVYRHDDIFGSRTAVAVVNFYSVCQLDLFPDREVVEGLVAGVEGPVDLSRRRGVRESAGFSGEHLEKFIVARDIARDVAVSIYAFEGDGGAHSVGDVGVRYRQRIACREAARIRLPDVVIRRAAVAERDDRRVVGAGDGDCDVVRGFRAGAVGGFNGVGERERFVLGEEVEFVVPTRVEVPVYLSVRGAAAYRAVRDRQHVFQIGDGKAAGKAAFIIIAADGE